MSYARIAGRLVPVIFEDEHILALNKPAGLAIEAPGSAGASSLSAILPELQPWLEKASDDVRNGMELFPLERLDRFASGVVLIAKSEEAGEAFAQQLNNEKTKNAYIAVVKGKPRTKFLRTMAAKGGTKIRFKTSKRAKKKAAPKKPIPSSLMFDLVKHKNDLSLVKFETGPAVEVDLRRRMASMSIPVYKDAKFAKKNEQRQVGRYFLHREELSIYHPLKKRIIHIKAAKPESFQSAVMGRNLVDEMLNTALAGRLTCLLNEHTDTFRLITGQVEGVPGLIAELYGKTVILETLQGKFQGDQDLLRHIGNWYIQTLGIKTVLYRMVARKRTGSDTVEDAVPSRKPLCGRRCDEDWVIRENGMLYLLRPFEGLNPGLFLDHRDNRRRIAEMSEDKKVLNLFAYTCGFSLTAAAGGAESVTSVDIQKTRLEWGKENFALNGLSIEPHVFVASETFDYFKRAQRQKKKFDLIIIDPPTFARSKKPKRTFELTSDLKELLEGAISLLEPKGHIFLSTNYRRATKRWLTEQVIEAAGPRRFNIVGSPPLPPDFAADRDHAKSLVVRF